MSIIVQKTKQILGLRHPQAETGLDIMASTMPNADDQIYFDHT